MSHRPLKVCQSEVEARFIAEYLVAEGFHAHVATYVQTSVYGTAQSLASAEVMVPEGEHARAAQALRDAPPFEFEGGGLHGVADARSGTACAVHQVAPSVPCGRCGLFVCPQCVAGEERPLCDDCDQKAYGELRKQYNRRDSWGLRFGAGVLGLFIVVLIATSC